MSRVNRFECFDASSLKPPVKMDNGFLKVEGRIARVGIQEYVDGAGKTHRELRLPEEVFDNASLNSFQQVPVTNRHPPGMLTAKNARKYAIGNVGENVRKDDTFVAAPLMITDEEAITSIQAGRSQLSNGYSCRLDDPDPSLVAQWGEHDGIQREIRGNHVALVDVARAGPEACLKLDSADSASSGFLPMSQTVAFSQEADKGVHPMGLKMKLDGFEVELADENAKAAVERAINAARKDEAEKAQKTITELQTKLDCATAQIKQDSEKLAKIDEMVEEGARKLASVMEIARKYLGKNETLDGGEIAIKRKVVAKLLPALDLAGRTDSGIRDCFDAALSAAPKEPTAIDKARAVMRDDTVRNDSGPSSSLAEARARFDERKRAISQMSAKQAYELGK